jgi:hypothetical protein
MMFYPFMDGNPLKISLGNTSASPYNKETTTLGTT